MTASRNSAFYWQGEPSIFATDRAFTAHGDKGRSLSQSATARYAGLTDPRNNMRKGGISLPADPQACSDKTAKIIGKALGAPRNAK